MSNQPPAPGPADSWPPTGRPAAAEAALVALSQEVRTRRLVVVDDRDRERIVAELVGDDAFLRLELLRPEGEGTTGLVLSVTTGGDVDSPEGAELAAGGAGAELAADGAGGVDPPAHSCGALTQVVGSKAAASTALPAAAV